LISLFNEWDPHLTVDLHTTDGSFHGYHLTYSVPLNPSSDAALISFHRNEMMPAITKAMQQEHHFRTYYYGNFATEDSLQQTIYAGEPKTPPKPSKIWRTFSPQPRVGFNYVGMRNRLCILSEAYSYLDFERRIEVTEAFVEEILRYAYAHSSAIRRVTQEADGRTVRAGRSGTKRTIGVEYAPRALPKPVAILTGEVIKKRNPLSGAEMTAMVEDKVTPVKMLDYGLFAATRSVAIAHAYLLPAQAGLAGAVNKLKEHGIVVEELTRPLTTSIRAFTVSKVERARRRFQGHDGIKISGDNSEATMEFEPGTYVVKIAQPLGLLAAYLLEPESDDGLVAWNFLDDVIELKRAAPIYKLMKDAELESRVVSTSAEK
jgi:hypothetical protein